MGAEGGLLVSVRRLLATLAELAQVRLELAATEIEIAKLRTVDALLIGATAVIALGIGLMLLCALLVWWAGEAWRGPVLAGLAAVFAGGGLLGIHVARRRLRAAGAIFEASTAELAHDRAVWTADPPSPPA